MAIISKRMREVRLRCLGDVVRKTGQDVIMTTCVMEVSGHRNIERPN